MCNALVCRYACIATQQPKQQQLVGCAITWRRGTRWITLSNHGTGHVGNDFLVCSHLGAQRC